MDSLFTRIKAVVTPLQAAEHYGLPVKRGGMTCCIFHNDRHPSMKLYPDHYYCFGCHASGDVIDLVAKMFSLSPMESAKKLAMDFGFGPRPVGAACAKPMATIRIAAEKQSGLYLKLVSDYIGLLRKWKTDYAPWCRYIDEEWHERFILACRKLSLAEWIFDCLISTDNDLRLWMEQECLKTGLFEKMERLLRENEQEETEIGSGEYRIAG